MPEMSDKDKALTIEVAKRPGFFYEMGPKYDYDGPVDAEREATTENA